MRKKIMLILLITVVLFISIYMLGACVKRKNNIIHDNDLLYSVTTAFIDLKVDVYYSKDEKSINTYNSFFDGNIHYLHEIDENTKLGKLMLQKIGEKKYDMFYYDVESFEEYENKIKTSKHNKSFAIYYTKDGYLHVYIPNSSDAVFPWENGEEIQIHTKVYHKFD